MSDRVICSKCGADEVLVYDTAETAFCPKCCEEHDYKYDRFERTWVCDNCGEFASDEWLIDFYSEN